LRIKRWCLDSGAFTCPGTVFYISGAIYALSGLFCYILFTKFATASLPAKDISISGSINEEDEGKELLVTSMDEREDSDSQQ
jgi:hypothetical protein